MSPEQWLAEHESIEAAAEEHLAVPILSGKVACNPPENVLDADNDGWALLPKAAVKHPRSTFALRVQGDAMAPAVPKGALIGIDCSVRDPKKIWKSGKRLVAVRDAKSGCIIRRLEKAEQYWVFVADSGVAPLVWAGNGETGCPMLGTVVVVISAER
jgi:SOS-response transcriptional repressor LexA